MPESFSLRVFLSILLLAGAAVSGLATPFGGAGIARAASISPAALALPHGLFPAGSTIEGAPAGNRKAGTASALHTVPLAQLGRTGGYLELARWTTGHGHAASLNSVTLQYDASLFRLPGQTDAAYVDARASLWEAGTPRALPGTSIIALTIKTGSKRLEIDVLGYRGTIEYELSLRFGASIQRFAREGAIKQLVTVASAAAKTIARLVGPIVTPAASPSPSIYVAPWGTGPVVKSPSLMVMASTGLPGAFRIAPAPVATRASGHPSAVPADYLSRFVQISTDGTGTERYDVAALSSSTQDAAQAFDTLAKTNDAQPDLRPTDLQSLLSSMKRLAAADSVRVWTGTDETILIARYQNVVMVLLQTGTSALNLTLVADGLGATVPTWLHTDGTSVVDTADLPVHLAGLNWYGAEEQDFVVGGLDYRPYQDILATMSQLGYNSIRLPFSDQLVEQNPVVTAHLAANPELQGMHALEILDRIIERHLRPIHRDAPLTMSWQDRSSINPNGAAASWAAHY